MTPRRLGLAGALALLTLCGFWFFPGHTYLQADTQIYVPILERLWDPTLFAKDPVALYPHVSYTIYDEMAILLRRITGQPFQFALQLQQILFRGLGLYGLFLIGTALGLSWRLALLLTSVYGLGATVNGPAVLTLEYEPIPRTYALQLVVLAIGLLARNKWVWAGVACGMAYLYHPPTTVPFLAMLALLTLWKREWRVWAPIVGAFGLGWLISQFQPGLREHQEFFGTIDAELERMQKLRGAYNWFSLWPVQYIRHYEFLLLAGMFAFWRIRAKVPETLRLLLLGLPLFGVAAVAANWVLLEQVKWAFMPQFQPSRAILFVTFAAIITVTTAGIYAALERRRVEAVLWMLLAFVIPQTDDVLSLYFPNVRDGVLMTRFAIALGLAGASYFAVRSRVAWAAVLALPFYLIPTVGKVQNYAPLHTAEVYQLSDWAKANTGKEDLFVFPDAGRALHPGIFRVNAQRALYVDWKSGGQVNLLRHFAKGWWDRWQKAGGETYDPSKIPHLGEYGIDYFVLKKANKLADRSPVYENAGYVVYRAR